MPQAKNRTKARPSKAKGTGWRKGGKQTGRNGFVSFITSPVLRRLVLVVVIAGLLYWFMPRLIGLGTAAWQSLLSLFGVGLGILVAAIGVLVWVLWRGFSVLGRHWNCFIGGAILALGLWGLLSFFSPAGSILNQVTLGGRVGQSIIGAPDITGGLRVAGLVLLGIIFIIPARFWRGLKKACRGVGSLFARPPRRRPEAIRVRPETFQPPLPEAAPSRSLAGAAEKAAKLVVPFSPPPTPAAAEGIWKHQREPILTPSGWQIPPIDILDSPREVEMNKDDLEKRARLIEEALNSYGVEAKVVQINRGPTVTQFGIEPGWDRKYKKVIEKGQERMEEVSRTRIRVDRITSLSNDLALALAAPSLRFEAPVPGKSMVGIEVPNSVFGSVALRSVVETSSFQRIHARSKLAVALGKGAGGEAVAADLARMPHLLIAGATGSGKTVCLDSVVCCLLLHNSPDDVRFIMVDPKRVELVVFDGLPHLSAPVVVDTDKAIKALRWLNQEMDRRYHKLAETGVRNIEGYNKDKSPGERLPYLVLIIDELADLMMAAFDEVEHTLCRLAQLARATGIHLIVATQRPSVDVVTGLIKANFPTRISFAVTSQVDSRTILDTVGAEKLLGRGDMLFLPSEASRPKRLQGTFVSDAEIEKLVYFWANQRELKMSRIDFGEVTESATLSQRLASAPDPLFEEAKQLAQEHKHISTSFLQRRLRIGYPRAARLMEALEQEGFGGAEQPKNEG
ncbi:MAG: DNA translocase FtsK [Chloroflexota bacterium]|nr:DNA translocase FtsK [Chloroflexota bacterium]